MSDEAKLLWLAEVNMKQSNRYVPRLRFRLWEEVPEGKTETLLEQITIVNICKRADISRAHLKMKS